MISDSSIDLIIKIISAGNVCSIHPMEWDSAQAALVVNHKWRHTWVPFLLTLEYCILVGYSTFSYTIKSQSDFIIVFFIWAALTCSYLMLFWLNRNSTSYVTAFNGFIFFNSLESNARCCKVHFMAYVMSCTK